MGLSLLLSDVTCIDESHMDQGEPVCRVVEAKLLIGRVMTAAVGGATTLTLCMITTIAGDTHH